MEGVAFILVLSKQITIFSQRIAHSSFRVHWKSMTMTLLGADQTLAGAHEFATDDLAYVA
jgi:hypothetical protein